ncbi:hypothetical protein [Geobacter sp. DSM 9736]|uniref:hypothetical protein n=1 Tax=Geobacter sp. DSM 9736 TaxID=1277350 RepID=UPI000B4FF679|nr:hypothetical protein [Geobacter sp. DSM 9736]SNB45410.1 hypothetical protein SAMN06269301_0823 [Geobacter sp. DSM 9736]
MRIIMLAAGIVALGISLAAPVKSDAAEKKVKSEVVMKMGSKVHLFHSGSVEASKEISIGDVLTVSRQATRTGQAKEIGQVKVLSFIGEHYFEAEVVKGDIEVGDIAKGSAGAYLVQPAK